MAAPSMTFNAPGNVRSSSALSIAATHNVDFSTVLEGQVTIKNTPGATVSGTRGLRVSIMSRYGSGPATTTIAQFSVTLPSAVASTAESYTLYLSPGKYQIGLLNLDSSNDVTVEITSDTVDEIA